MGKELSPEHSKFFSDWCSELREIRTMSINRLYFENGCTNLRRHFFTDASEQAMSTVAYLQEEATLKPTYVIGKCRVAPIRQYRRQNFKPQSTEFASESRYSANMMSELTKSIIGPTHQQFYSGYKQHTRNNKCSLQTEQWNYWKTHRWINGDTSKV